jgi:hypothetical protein
MKACPKCSNGFISIDTVLAAKPLGSYSIAGVQNKVVALPRARAFCSSCDFQVVGYLENPTYAEDGAFTGGYFVEEKYETG